MEPVDEELAEARDRRDRRAEALGKYGGVIFAGRGKPLPSPRHMSRAAFRRKIADDILTSVPSAYGPMGDRREGRVGFGTGSYSECLRIRLSRLPRGRARRKAREAKIEAELETALAEVEAMLDEGRELREHAAAIKSDLASDFDLVVSNPTPKPQADTTMCAWESCSEPRQARSKYCSVSCRNKNARARAKAREASP